MDLVDALALIRPTGSTDLHLTILAGRDAADDVKDAWRQDITAYDRQGALPESLVLTEVDRGPLNYALTSKRR